MTLATPTADDKILVVSKSTQKANEFLQILHANEKIELKTKYFHVLVPVIVRSSLETPINPLFRAIIILDDAVNALDVLAGEETAEEDRIQIFFTDDEITYFEKCIDCGVELVRKTLDDENESEYGIPRIISALESRMWTVPDTSTPDVKKLGEDEVFQSFEILMSKISDARNNANDLSDNERRQVAERIASEFRNMLMCGDDSSDSD